MWSWLRRWFVPPPAAAATAATAAAVAVAPAVYDAGSLIVEELDAAALLPDPNEAAVMERPPDGPLLAQVEALAEILREYHRAHPPDPASYPALAGRLLAHRAPEYEELLDVAEQDLAIGAVLMRAAASPQYYRGRPVRDVRDALTLLGVRDATRLATATAAKVLFDLEERLAVGTFPDEVNRQFHHAMTVAHVSVWLAGELGIPAAETAFLAGLFHDVGKSLALRSLSALVLDNHVSPGGEAVLDPLLESVHVELGVAMHERFGLPAELTEVCRHHHDSIVPVTPAHAITHIIRIVSGLNELRLRPGRLLAIGASVRQSLRALSLTRAELRALHDELRRISAYVTDAFGIALAPPRALPSAPPSPPPGRQPPSSSSS